MLETNVMVAPNSPRLRAKDKRTPVMIPGSASGKVMVRNTPMPPAPNVLAAASSLRSVVATKGRTARPSSGTPMLPAASAAPVHLNAMTMPNHSSSSPPSGPRLPKRSRRKYPTTTGGSTRGRCTTASNSVLPGNVARASRYAIATARGRLASTLQNDTRRLSRRISNSSAVKLISGRVPKFKAIFSKHGASSGLAQRFQERARAALARCHDRRRIDDRRVGIFREFGHDPDPLLDCGVGAVHDSKWRLAPRDQNQGRPHVLGSHHLRLNVLPDSESFQGRLAVLAGGYRIGIGHRKSTISENPGKRKPRFDFHRRHAA